MTSRSTWRSLLIALPLAALTSYALWWVGVKFGGKPSLAWLRWEGEGTIVVNSINMLILFTAIVDLLSRSRSLGNDARAFQEPILPEDPSVVIDQSHIRKIFDKLKALPVALRETRLAKTIEVCAARYQTGMSVSEISDAMKLHLENESNRSDTGYSLVRYLAWAIPSIGFIGTVMGLSQALGRFGSVDTNAGSDQAGNAMQELMKGAATDLMFAFNTTFVALVAAILLMYVYHRVIEREETLHNRISDYCLNHFILKAYYPTKG